MFSLYAYIFTLRCKYIIALEYVHLGAEELIVSLFIVTVLLNYQIGYDGNGNKVVPPQYSRPGASLLYAFKCHTLETYILRWRLFPRNPVDREILERVNVSNELKYDLKNLT